jgi:FkbH-like protein
MKDFFQLVKNLSKDLSGMKVIRVALLGDTSTQFLARALRGYGYESNVNLTIWEAEYDQIANQVYDTGSELYAQQPEIVIIYQASHKLLSKYNKLPISARAGLADDELASIAGLYSTLTARLQAKVILYNYAEIDDSVYGNHSAKVASSFTYQLRKLNYELMTFARDQAYLYLCDLSSIQNRIGRATLFQPAVYIQSEMVISVDALPTVAARTLELIQALQGNFKKCLILDLDNTLWGGVIGDDGLENIQLGTLGTGKAFTEFQYWIKKLKERGIILAVCSKNNESTAMEVFEKHPDMVLRMDDIAVFVANWETKVDNIRYIQSILNIGFDSMVFIDDQAFERQMVRENIPGICVPEMPEDPADYLEFLYALNLFETVSISEEDAERTLQYRTEAKRLAVQRTFDNEDDFLNSLQMISVVEPFNAFNTPRVAQLSQRSNQFNLRTLRYTEADVERIQGSDDYISLAFTLKDRFGDHGLICVVVAKKENDKELFIENWFMSCRVLKRGMEQFVLNTLIADAKKQAYETLIGEYLPTAKNEMVASHYEKLGFKKDMERWTLSISSYSAKKCHIQNNAH